MHAPPTFVVTLDRLSAAFGAPGQKLYLVANSGVQSVAEGLVKNVHTNQTASVSALRTFTTANNVGIHQRWDRTGDDTGFSEHAEAEAGSEQCPLLLTNMEGHHKELAQALLKLRPSGQQSQQYVTLRLGDLAALLMEAASGQTQLSKASTHLAHTAAPSLASFQPSQPAPVLNLASKTSPDTSTSRPDSAARPSSSKAPGLHQVAHLLSATNMSRHVHVAPAKRQPVAVPQYPFISHTDLHARSSEQLMDSQQPQTKMVEPSSKELIFAKVVTRSDAQTRRIIIPRQAVETKLPHVVSLPSYSFRVTDHKNLAWTFIIRSWQNGTNPKPVYVLEHISEYFKAYNIQEGDAVGLFVQPDGRALVELNSQDLLTATQKPASRPPKRKAEPNITSSQSHTQISEEEDAMVIDAARLLATMEHVGQCYAPRRVGTTDGNSSASSANGLDQDELDRRYAE